MRLSDIADVIKRRGFLRRNFVHSGTGAVCTLGAVYVAVTGDEEATKASINKFFGRAGRRGMVADLAQRLGLMGEDVPRGCSCGCGESRYMADPLRLIANWSDMSGDGVVVDTLYRIDQTEQEDALAALDFDETEVELAPVVSEEAALVDA